MAAAVPAAWPSVMTVGVRRVVDLQRDETPVRNFVRRALRQAKRRGAGSLWVVNVDRIRAARDGVRKLTRLEDVFARQRVLADDAARFPDADLRRRCGQPRVFEAWDALAKEIEKLH